MSEGNNEDCCRNVCRGEPGRRGAARRRAMLDAAYAVFMEQGYAHGSLSEIIARSGGSRATLYEQFGGKDGLFETVMADACERFIASFESLLDDDSLAPEQALACFGRHFLDAVLSRDAQTFNNMIMSERARFPHLAGSFYRNGPLRVQERLAAYLAKLDQAGLARVPHPDLAASALLGMLVGQMDLRLAAGQPPDDAEKDAFIAEAVRIFLHGIQAA